MFFHIFKYRIKTIFHTKEEVFWILIFPILLGTCFFAAFSNISSSTENFETIDVAIVLDADETPKYIFDAMSDKNTSSENETALLHITYCDISKATDLLNSNDITGIISFTNNTPELTVVEESI